MMIPDPQDREALRQMRAKDRARRKRKRIIRYAAIAAGVVALIVALIFLFGGIGGSGGAVYTDEDITTIHFVAGGDLRITDRLMEAGETGNGYQDVFMDVAGLLADADLTALNLEGTFCGAPYGEESASVQESLAKALKKAGVDALQLANSYSIYQGVAGLDATMDVLRRNGLDAIGVTDNYQEKSYVIYEVQGVRVALVAFTKGMEESSRIPDAGAGRINLLYTDYTTAYQKVDTEGILRVLRSIEAEKPDITIAMLHWGSKEVDTISSTQKKILSLMQENGVDAVIGNHSHRVQQLKLDSGGNFTAYSLGDFCSDASAAGTEYSVLLDLEIRKNEKTGKTWIESYSYTPTFSVAEEGKPLRVVRLLEAMKAYEQGYMNRVSAKTYSAMQYALSRIESRVAGNG